METDNYLTDKRQQKLEFISFIEQYPPNFQAHYWHIVSDKITWFMITKLALTIPAVRAARAALRATRSVSRLINKVRTKKDKLKDDSLKGNSNILKEGLKTAGSLTAALLTLWSLSKNGVEADQDHSNLDADASFSKVEVLLSGLRVVPGFSKFKELKTAYEKAKGAIEGDGILLKNSAYAVGYNGYSRLKCPFTVEYCESVHILPDLNGIPTDSDINSKNLFFYDVFKVCWTGLKKVTQTHIMPSDPTKNGPPHMYSSNEYRFIWKVIDQRTSRMALLFHTYHPVIPMDLAYDESSFVSGNIGADCDAAYLAKPGDLLRCIFSDLTYGFKKVVTKAAVHLDVSIDYLEEETNLDRDIVSVVVKDVDLGRDNPRDAVVLDKDMATFLYRIIIKI
jgi:hypothetical protein